MMNKRMEQSKNYACNVILKKCQKYFSSAMSDDDKKNVINLISHI